MKKLSFLVLSVLCGVCLALSTACAADVDQVQLEYPAILSCFQIDNAKKVRAYRASVRGMSLMVMEIDTNEDGVRDGMLLYPIVSEEENVSADIVTVPAYLILDTNYDGVPDVAYFDRTRTGNCETLQSISLGVLLKDAERKA